MKKHPDYKNLYVEDHPLVLHKLSLMREAGCPKADFKALLREIALLMTYAVTKSFPLTTREIETPVAPMTAPFLDGKKPVIVPILRAGLGMANAVEEVMPSARVGHIGLYRDHVTHEPVEYLVKIPLEPQERTFILVDPMLATGNSTKHAVGVLVRRGVDPRNIKFMGLVAAPEGVKAVEAAYPQVQLFIAALDDHLNDHAYIVPGLGDAGDRLFGTLGV